MSEYRATSHCKYLCQYHLIWCPKFRFDVLQGDVVAELKTIISQMALHYDYEVIELEVMSEHVHIFVGAKPTVAPVDIVRTIKSISAIELFKAFPDLKKFYGRCGSLWSPGKFISTIGKVSEATIKRYIQEQKGQ